MRTEELENINDRYLKYITENAYVNKSFSEVNRIYRPENYKKD